jgi:hypothetical protein
MEGRFTIYVNELVKLKNQYTLSPHMLLKNFKAFAKNYNKILDDTEFKSYKIPYSRAKKMDVPDFVNKFRKAQDDVGAYISKTTKANNENEIVNLFKKKYLKTPNNKILLVHYKNQNSESTTRIVNEKMITYINDFIAHGMERKETSKHGSDVNEDLESITKFALNDFYFTYKNKAKISQNGKYFNYINKTTFDLSPIQIYNKNQYIEKSKQGIQNCVIHSLRAFDIDEETLNKLKNIIQKYDSTDQHKAMINDSFIARNFKKIAQVIKRNILLKKIYTQEKNPMEWIYNMHNEILESDFDIIEKNMNIYKYSGKCTKKPIAIVLYQNHYMPIIELDINSFVVKNYNEIKNIKGFMNFTRKRNNKYSSEKLNNKAKTTDIIRMLERTKLYGKDEVLTNHIKYEEDNTFYLNGDDEQHEIEDTNKNKKKNKNKKVYFADCETFKKFKRLYPFLIGVVGMNSDTVTISKSVHNFLKKLTENTKEDDEINVYFHNAKFDYSVMFRDFMKESPIIKNGQFYKGTILFNNRKVIIKDSMKHINMALSKFKSTYKLKVGKKDIYMPYSLFDINTIKTGSVDYNLLFNNIKKTGDDYDKLTLREQQEEDLKDYIPDIEKLNTKEKIDCVEPYTYITKSGNKRFMHMKFMMDYLKSDCLTLKHGFLKHRENMFQLCKVLNVPLLDIFDILTTSSYSHELYKSVGTYKNVYELSGNKRRFVQKSIIGGRVGTEENGKHMSKFVMDYDACSLYPSAIYRLKQEFGGIPTGMAKNIKNFNDIKNNTYYVVEIKVNDIKDNQQISFFNYVDNNGTRKYSGNYEDFIKHNPSGKIVVDRITLKDYVKYQHLKYDFIQGLYWDEFSPIMSEMTHHLYDLRKKYKATKVNGVITDEAQLMQNTTKLILNSIYGKTLLKPATEKIVTKMNTSYIYKMVEEKIEYISEKTGKTCYKTIKKHALDDDGNKIHLLDINDDKVISKPAEMYLTKNYNIINHMCIENKVTTFHINYNDFEDKNSCHIGGMILSMSKRIMNEVMDLANTEKIEILYQDTDSMHIPKKYIKELENKFKQKFNRDLNGNELGQFHNDLTAYFDGIEYNCESEKCIILGKKAYLDVLKIDFDCEKNKQIIKNNKLNIDELKTKKTNHVRLKGIGEFCVNRNYNDVVKVYEDLYNGKKLDFDLTKGSVKFSITNMNNIIQRDNFIRQVSF